ncbi:MAG: PilT/PilU family type 4a pilus ATPase [Phycisphaerales bacterium]|nr:PilT/PilU family type 4a pilus ATPase [Phycisphaerales bacterium]
MDLHAILRRGVAEGASDIHIVSERPPALRVRTHIIPLDLPAPSSDDVARAIREAAPPEAAEAFQANHDADFSLELLAPDGSVESRFRVNAHRERCGPALSIRVTPRQAPELASLGLPAVVERFTRLPRGLALVTGHTGSGKTTTLAAMVEAINARDARHIITLEDPIEFVFENRRCLVQQRELGRDMPTFASGLRHALRQDPDVILVGEMRDLETASLAISAAETGHLVLSTLHTCGAAQTVERIIDMFPPAQQGQVRSMLANSLQGIVSQTLFRRQGAAPQGQRGMVAAAETLVCTPAARNLIREGRTFEIPNVIDTGKALGMQSMDASIAALHLQGLISRDDALARAHAPDRLDRQLAA